jgi:gibberellin 3-beta-dioxygenase
VISNGRYKSAKHRAVVNKKQDRYSLAYFAQPPCWDLIVPPQELLDSKHPPIYKPFSWKEYLETVVQHESDNVLESFIAQPDS